jgi:hypothetical protein
MTKALYFHTEREAELKNVKVKDGGIVVGDKKFFVDGWEYEDPETKEKKKVESKPIMLKKPFGMSEPLYLLKWDSVFPAEIEHKVEKRNLGIDEIKSAIAGGSPVSKNYVTNVVFTRDLSNTPESLYKTESLKILGGMLKVKREWGSFVPLIFGVAVGVIVAFLLFYFKLIRI